MEEKWWSKFQTKSADGNRDNDDYLSIDDIKEVVAEELQEKLDEAVAAGKKTSEDIRNWANEKIEEQPELKSALNTAKEKVSDVQEWASELWNQPKVQSGVEMVSRKSGEALAQGAKVVDEVKQFASRTLEKPEVKESIETVKETAEDLLASGAKTFKEVKMWSEDTLNRPEVKETVSVAKEKASEAIETGKQVVNQTLEWATELTNRPEVQQTVNTVKMKSREVVDEVKESIAKVTSDPKVQKNVETIKNSTTQFASKTTKTIKQGYEELKGDGLREEWKEFAQTAVKLGKQGARVLVTTVEEIRTNEKVIAAVEKGKEVSLDLLDRGVSALKAMMEKREERKMRQREFEEDWAYEVNQSRQKKQTEPEYEEELEREEISDHGFGYEDDREGQER